ncbi:MAG: LysR family transcriptional regulator [Ilumatobacteraceae bacterium]|nr:LysR family transcriptional regulator [Ilumatobacteraceae bacterium]
MVALQQVLCLEEVVRTRSFRAAAHALHMSQPAVSGHIARLERELNLTLLERAPSGSILTPAGERMLIHLRAFVDTAEHIRRASEQIQDSRQQSLTIIGETRRIHPMIPEAIAEITKTFENLTVRIISADEDAICTDVRAGRAEIAVFALEHGTLGPAHDIEPIPFFELGRSGAAFPSDHPALRTSPGPIPIDDLIGDPLITMSEHKSIELAERLFPAHSSASHSLVDDVAVGLQLVRGGMGIMLIDGVTSWLTNPAVPWRALADAPVYTACLGRLRGAESSPAALAFIDYVVNWGRHGETAFGYDPVTGTIEPSDVVRQWLAESGRATPPAEQLLADQSLAKFSK